MTANHKTVTADYLRSTQNILAAAQRVQESLAADRDTREDRIAGLARAAEEQETGGARFREFMFQELSTSPVADSPVRSQLAGESLAVVLTDLQVGNVLMAAGINTGEVSAESARIGPDEPPPPPPSDPRTAFSEAIAQLDSTTRSLERALPTTQTSQRQFGFTDASLPAPGLQSPNLQTSIETFRTKASQDLSIIVSESVAVITGIFDEIPKLGKDRLVGAIKDLGGDIPALQGVGRLIKMGIEKISSAIKWLIEFVGKEFLGKMKDKVLEVWKKVQNGELLTPILEFIYQIEAARQEIAQILGESGLQLEKVDNGSQALDLLAIRFKDNMAIARKLTSGVTLVGGLLSFIPVLGSKALLAAAFIDAVILGTVVWMGMDYADAGPLQRVPGVREICRGLRP